MLSKSSSRTPDPSAPEDKVAIGRPRDPEIRKRILTAAMDIYAERGWVGFNFDTVSQRAGVGRPALYRRWSKAHELLLDAFTEQTVGLQPIDSGAVETDLLQLASDYITTSVGSRSIAGIRIHIEGKAHPSVLHDVLAHVTKKRSELIRKIVEKGIQRGELREGIPPSMVESLMLGTIIHMFLASAGAWTTARQRTVAQQVVQSVLWGIGSRPQPTRTSKPPTGFMVKK